MCKICSSCKGLMDYDPYFQAEVCAKCGRIERGDVKGNYKAANGAKPKIEVHNHSTKAEMK